MKNTTITLHTGDCLTAPWRSKRNAWFPDTPANIAFMGRKWDKAAAELGFVPPLPPRSKAHLRELQSEFAFQRYWGERFGLMFDQSEDDAVAFVWALPRTAHLTQTALRWSGWRILDSWHHVFGQGWNKNGGHLKPAHELWFVALKGKPELNIDAGRVKRGERPIMGQVGPNRNGAAIGMQTRGRSETGETTTLGSHPPNFALSHHPDCVRIGERKVKGGIAVMRNVAGQDMPHQIYGDRKYPTSDSGFVAKDGTESLPAYSCAVSCPCGRRWIEPSGGSPGTCECGRQGEWVCPVAELDEQSGHLPGRSNKKPSKGGGGSFGLPKMDHPFVSFGDEGGASRFFPTFGYFAKAAGRVDNEGVPRGERHAGCEELYWRANKDNPFGFDRVTFEVWQLLDVTARSRCNVHPTVKGIEQLMYLIKLSGGNKIGDLCFGSGGTAIASKLLDLDFEGAELCPEAVEITTSRLAFWSGLSFSALEQFKLTGTLPTNSDTSNVGNLSLFD